LNIVPWRETLAKDIKVFHGSDHRAVLRRRMVGGLYEIEFELFVKYELNLERFHYSSVLVALFLLGHNGNLFNGLLLEKDTGMEHLHLSFN
jgi:hypothetical protein